MRVDEVFAGPRGLNHSSGIVFDRKLEIAKCRSWDTLHCAVRKRPADNATQQIRGIACCSRKAMNEQIIGSQFLLRPAHAFRRPKSPTPNREILPKKIKT